MSGAQKQRLQEAERDLKRIPEWVELTQEEQNSSLDQLSDLALSVQHDLGGLEQLVTHEFDIQSRLADLKRRIVNEGHERQRQRVEEQKEKDTQEAKQHVRSRYHPHYRPPCRLKSSLDNCRCLKAELAYYDEFELTIEPIQKAENQD